MPGPTGRGPPRLRTRGGGGLICVSGAGLNVHTESYGDIYIPITPHPRPPAMISVRWRRGGEGEGGGQWMSAEEQGLRWAREGGGAGRHICRLTVRDTGGRRRRRRGSSRSKLLEPRGRCPPPPATTRDGMTAAAWLPPTRGTVALMWGRGYTALRRARTGPAPIHTRAPTHPHTHWPGPRVCTSAHRGGGAQAEAVQVALHCAKERGRRGVVDMHANR